jgi:hypothetical protein
MIRISQMEYLKAVQCLVHSSYQVQAKKQLRYHYRRSSESHLFLKEKRSALGESSEN